MKGIRPKRLHPTNLAAVAAFKAISAGFAGADPARHGRRWCSRYPHRRISAIWMIDRRSVRKMRTMRSIVADTVGEPSEVLHLQRHPIPEPGPGEVRIRVTATPVEASDLHTVRGRYGFTPEFPTVPGIESVGVIDRLG